MTVKVKPLVWDRHPDAYSDPTCNEHYGGGQNNLAWVNEYDVFPHPCAVGMFVLDVMGNRCEDDFPSVEAAKAAAQADYEARILSAIDTTDLEAHIGAVLAEAEGYFAQQVANIQERLDGPGYGSLPKKHVEDVIERLRANASAMRAIRPGAFTALDRAKREARAEALEQAAEAVDRIGPRVTGDAIRALIEAERGKP